jgi:serine/threonine-protein kinase
MVMEYVPNGDLKQWAKNHAPLTVRAAVDLLQPIADALDYAHSQGLVHRDVKPSNLLLTARDTLKLSDFGLVKAARAGGGTATTALIGTPTYMSPEQAQSQPVDGKADQYSLGVVMYELLTGKPPFVGETPVAISLLHATKMPTPPSQARAEVPPEVDDVLLKALAKKPDQRYATCAEFLKALRLSVGASEARRFKDLLTEAQQLTARNNFEEARARLSEAGALSPNRPEVAAAVEDVTQRETWFNWYTEGVTAWRAAQQKAQAVLELAPQHPDPQNILVALGLRLPPPERSMWVRLGLRRARPLKEVALTDVWRGLALGGAVGGGITVVLLGIAFLFITR